MRTVLQRVSEASVNVSGKVHSSIGQGLLILLGIESADIAADIDWLVSKISQMRIFPDMDDKMNLNIMDVKGEILVVSQFTLHAATKKGNRPSFIRAAHPDQAKPMYEAFTQKLKDITNLKVATGVFGAMMQVHLINSGPVTILLDSKNKE